MVGRDGPELVHLPRHETQIEAASAIIKLLTELLAEVREIKREMRMRP